MSFADKLKTIRNSKGISQKEMSQLIGLHINDISRYERGVQTPSIEVIKRIARTFNVSTDYLLFDDYQEITSEEIKDTILINYFKIITALSDKDKNLIVDIIDAVITRSELK